MRRLVTEGESSASPEAIRRMPVDQLLGRRALEQEPARAGAQRFEHVLVELERGEDQHPRRELAQSPDAAGRLEPVDARHADVHDHNVWMQLRRGLDRGCAVAGLADHLEVPGRVEDHA
jgi:hypothetical protein